MGLKGLLLGISVKTYLKCFRTLPLLSGNLAVDIGGNIIEAIDRLKMFEPGWRSLWQADLIELNTRETLSKFTDSELDNLAIHVEKIGLNLHKQVGEGFLHGHRLFGAYIRSIHMWDERSELYVSNYRELPEPLRSAAEFFVVTIEAYQNAH